MMSLISTSISSFLEQLQSKLKVDLIGENAHLRMVPKGRKLHPEPGVTPKKSAVLIAFYYEQGELYFPIIKRTTNNGAHSGQMALPGGKFEDNDKSLINTALREAYEEVGIQPEKAEILGCLSEIYIAVTNISVLPVVAYLPNKPNFICCKDEVAELFKIKLSEITKLENHKGENWNIQDEEIYVPYYELAKQKVWGATAMILSELETILTD